MPPQDSPLRKEAINRIAGKIGAEIVFDVEAIRSKYVAVGAGLANDNEGAIVLVIGRKANPEDAILLEFDAADVKSMVIGLNKSLDTLVEIRSEQSKIAKGK